MQTYAQIIDTWTCEHTKLKHSKTKHMEKYFLHVQKHLRLKNSSDRIDQDTEETRVLLTDLDTPTLQDVALL